MAPEDSAPADEHLAELTAAFELLSDTLEPRAARVWLLKPNPSLGHQTPVELLRAGEVRRVVGALEALADGAFV